MENIINTLGAIICILIIGVVMDTISSNKDKSKAIRNEKRKCNGSAEVHQDLPGR